MRMWTGIPVQILCRKHLLGFHNELHKFKPSFVKKFSIKGRIFPIVQIEPQYMEIAHNELAEEMIRRGYNHNSSYKLPDLSYLPDNQRYAKADAGYNIADLFDRCVDCYQRYLDM